MESVTIVQAQPFAGINSPLLLDEGRPGTPDRDTTSMPQPCSTSTSECADESKPALGMTFEGLEAVEAFYKSFAHRVGFGVRVGQQKVVDNVVESKRYMCSSQGFRSEKGKRNVKAANKKRKREVTRCGCDAHIYVKRCSGNTYKIHSMIEQHNHGFVPPDKLHLIRSNRGASEKEKVIPDCDEALRPSIGMVFEGLSSAEEFYKSYARHCGFKVRVGQHKLLNKEVVQFKRFMCSREGFRSDKGEDPSNEKKKRNVKVTRCGCNAHIVVRWCSGNTYKVSSLIEHHNHGLVSPDKVTKSKRRVSEKAKNKLSSSLAPECDEAMKPSVGMVFEDIGSVEEFYKSYAHHCGFSVRVGQRKLLNNEVVQWKRFMCSREGFRSEKCMGVDDPSRKRKVRKVTRCGCDARIIVKRCTDNKYKITSWIEHHNHGFVSPDKCHLIRSNRQLSDKAKPTVSTHCKASTCTSQANQPDHVSEGRSDNVGCTKRDLQKYHHDLCSKIKNEDAQIFVAQLCRKQQEDSAFFFDCDVDDQGMLVHVFWADATSRKNYIYFSDILTFDSTNTMNQHGMIFAPFTGTNHHLQSVSFGAAFLADEKIESYAWLFQTFLRAMGGVSPKTIVTRENNRMKAAISNVLPATTHRLCMLEMLGRMPEKVEPSLRNNPLFQTRMNECVLGSETVVEFESKWESIISDFGLQGNQWLAERYSTRERWILAYSTDVHLSGILRSTAWSKSAKSFFNCFINQKLSLVEFWLRFEAALECQRQEESNADHTSAYTTPQLITPWGLEKHGSVVFTHEVFERFQEEIVAARDHCVVEDMAQNEGVKTVAIGGDDSDKVREVRWDAVAMTANCSCKLFESVGIPCRHINLVLRSSKLNELPSSCVLKRWQKSAKFG
ncbi:protein FAR1-RELATED SEQUENCE 5-like [Triticum dicoccoides]|uniref:protein FAR1-RELATED SEQUENCE 5-like n=1 Tax=Triticum dicoccoides TaxID=85692 RepID=UPI000E7CBEBA|nr:protein FAR1-RELATED SEQUENCE 5-like [Triticum dicoccoides]